MILTTVADVLARLDRSALTAVAPLAVSVGPIRLRLRCAGALRAELAAYFADVLSEDAPDAIEIDILEGQPLDPAPEWVDWAREPGKTGRKDAIHDLRDGRLVFKRRTGVTFLQSRAARVAFGPVGANANQVINFVNTQVLNACLRDGWQICHAAAVTNGARVAGWLRRVVAQDSADTTPTLTLVFGHGAAFRHAAHELGILSLDEISRFSMYHARPLLLCYKGDDTWVHCGGAWKPRARRETALD